MCCIEITDQYSSTRICCPSMGFLNILCTCHIICDTVAKNLTVDILFVVCSKTIQDEGLKEILTTYKPYDMAVIDGDTPH